MADKEIMKDAELDEVVGGSGIECMGFLSRLQQEGLYTPKTPLVAGNEAAAAQELLGFLHSIKNRGGYSCFDNAKIYSDGRINFYGTYYEDRATQEMRPSNADATINMIKSLIENGDGYIQH